MSGANILAWITIHILPNISRSKGNQAMKLGQVTQYNKRNLFLQSSCRIWDMKSSLALFLFFFKKALYEEKASGLQLSFNIFR